MVGSSHNDRMHIKDYQRAELRDREQWNQIATYQWPKKSSHQSKKKERRKTTYSLYCSPQ
jgi:hypothetical protein